MIDVAAPRFGSARGPHYESYYVRAWDPVVPRALWIRYTTFRADRGGHTGSLWVTAFEPHGVTAFRQDALMPRPGADGRWISVGDARIGDDAGDTRVHGAAASNGHTATWDLRLRAQGPPWFHLAPSLLYGTRLPKTKSISPMPLAAVAGSARIDGVERTYPAAMLGHNWGSEHAHQWIWIHGADASGAVVDIVGGRLRVAGRTLPWKLSGLVQVDGRRTRIGGLAARARVAASEAHCVFSVSGVHGEAIAGPSARWRYEDPTGGEHDVTNSSIATLRLMVDDREIMFAAAAYEFGTAPRPPDGAAD